MKNLATEFPTRTASPELLAWAAGLIDGEGFIGQHHHSHRGCCLEVGMRDRAPVERLRLIFQSGHVRCYQQRSRTRPTWRYAIHRRDEVDRALLLLLPYLVVKEQDARLTLAIHAAIRRGGDPAHLHEQLYARRTKGRREGRES